MLDEPPELDAHRRSAETGSESAPGFIADLDTRHAITRRMSPCLRLLLALPTTACHVYVVNGVADTAHGVKLCAARRAAQ